MLRVLPAARRFDEDLAQHSRFLPNSRHALDSVARTSALGMSIARR